MATMKGKIGYWWSEKKSSKLNVAHFASLLAQRGFELVKIDLDSPLDQQGPFDLIVHKLSDIVVKANNGDQLAAQQLARFQEYVASNPKMVIIDPLDDLEKLLDRSRQYALIEALDNSLVFTPTFAEFTTMDRDENLAKMKAANVSFPFVCKPVEAHGSSFAHQMSLIFSEKALADIQPPCVAQTFINHNARLFKLFLIKDKYFVIERPSLKNFRAGDFETIHFDSHDISKPDCSSFLTRLDEEDRLKFPVRDPKKEDLERIVSLVRSQIKMSLIGIDIIIENDTGRYAIIDMNAFPGYDGVTEFLEILADLIVAEVMQMKSPLTDEVSSSQSKDNDIKTEAIHSSTPTFRQPMNSVNPTKSPPPGDSMANGHRDTETNVHMMDIDSGIDTSDSCDEKKKKDIKPLPKPTRRLHSRVSSSKDMLAQQQQQQNQH